MRNAVAISCSVQHAIASRGGCVPYTRQSILSLRHSKVKGDTRRYRLGWICVTLDRELVIRMGNLTQMAQRVFVTLVLLLLAACGTSSTATPTASPIPLPSLVPTDVEAFCPLPRNWVTYLTQPGDSLRSLAERTSSTITQLATANCLNNPRALPSGQVFYLPRPPITP